MSFFNSDLNLAVETADPKVSGMTQIGGGGAAPMSSSRSLSNDPLSQFARALNGSSNNASGWNDWGNASGTSGIGTGGFGGTGGGFGGTSGGFGGTPIFGAPTAPTAPTASPSYASSSDGSNDGGDNSSFSGPQNLEEYLRAKEQTPSWQTYGARALIPGFSAMSSLTDLSYGINPFANTKLGGLFGASPTTSWYEGDTTYEGAPISSSASSLGGGMFSGAGTQYERDIVDMFGVGSPEHFEAIGETFGETPTAAPMNQEYVVDPRESSFTEIPTTAPISQEYVVPKNQGTVVPISEEGTNMDNTAGGYTWDSDYGSISDMQEETGLGTQEWDSSAEGFSWDDSSSDSDGGSDSGGGGSYIATAATQALGEGGLKLFEDWRDYMFTALPTFTTSYGRYRVTAPKIVAEIDKREDSKQLYSWIWDMHLKPIFNLIKEDKDSEKALRDYKTMVKELQIRFLKEKV